MSDGEKVAELPKSNRTIADKLVDENKKVKTQELEKATKEAAAALAVFTTAMDKVQFIKDELNDMDDKQRHTLKLLGL